MVYPTHNENLSKLTHPVTHKKVASQITQMRVKRQNLTPQNEANQKNLKLNKKIKKTQVLKRKKCRIKQFHTNGEDNERN